MYSTEVFDDADHDPGSTVTVFSCYWFAKSPGYGPHKSPCCLEAFFTILDLGLKLETGILCFRNMSWGLKLEMVSKNRDGS